MASNPSGASVIVHMNGSRQHSHFAHRVDDGLQQREVN
jgi:hypothetical protein